MNIEVPEWPIWNNPKCPDVTAVNLFDHKNDECIAYVFDDDGHVHFALKLDEHVITFEHIPENYPATDVAFYATEELWRKTIITVDWIVAGLRQGRLGFPTDPPGDPIIDRNT